MKDYRVYVGLNDADTKEQKYDTVKYISLLKKVCQSYHVPFSFILAEGGYFHENGEYTQEKSLIISLIDVEKTVVEEIARDLCVFFHQESVMVAESAAEVYFIQEKL